MVTLILDGYNVAHAVPEVARHLDGSLQVARDTLVRLCQAYQARRGDIGKIYVVFDGRDAEIFGSREQTQGGVTVLFSQKPEEADQRILRVIEAAKGPGRCVVVSNDNEVSNNARAFGASVLSVQQFYEQARQGPARHLGHPTSPGKADLPAGTARQITEDYRKHLERKRRV